jgi:hypothetical protein
MTRQLDIERDPFLTLLTDALRAGPGSPQWHDAVAQLKTANENVDEYRLLIEAREALESGKDFRSVRAGPGFTRKLMGGIEEQASQKRFPLGSLIAILSGVAVIVVIGVAAYLLYPRTPADDTPKAIDELASTYFPKELSSSTFDAGIGAMWRTIGGLPLETSPDGLEPGNAVVPVDDYIGGGIVANDPIQPSLPVAIQTALRIDHPSGALIPQVFVSNNPDFSADRATSSQELVWEIQGDAQKVVVAGQVTRQASINAKSPTHTVRVILKGDLAIVECDGHQLWSGHSKLDDKPRYIGVRFIRTGAKPTGDVRIQSVRVLTSNG